MRDESQAALDSIDRAELFQLIIESATDFAIFTENADGVVTSWSAGAEQIFGYSEAEILGSSGDVIFVGEDRDAGIPEDERHRAISEGRAVDERWHQRRDGTRIWASGLLMPLRRSDGFVKITRDRTEQYYAEQRLREREERFRNLANSIPQLIFTTRFGGERTWPSPQWIEYTGLGAEKSVGLAWLDAVHPDDRSATQGGWTEAGVSGRYYAEHRIWHASAGEYRWHQTRAHPLPGEPREAEWIGTMTEIHDLHTLKDRQQVLLAELQHRTRNLLGVVQAIASQTIVNSSTLEEFREEFEGRLRALGRVQSILAQVDFGDVPLRALIDAELSAHGNEATPSGKIQITGPDMLLASPAAQTLALGLHELATNAVKYGALAQPAGRLEVNCTFSGEGRAKLGILEWRESGVVMPKGGHARHRGYGTELLTRALPYQLKAQTELIFGPDGVNCTIAVPVKDPGQIG